MATKNFRSTVLEPTSEFAHGDKLRFTALATVGEVLKGSFSETTIGENGIYSIDLQYGKHRIDYKPYEGVWRHFADVEVSADTLATTLQDLSLASAPVTDETILVLQGILADAETAKTAAEAAKTSADTALASIDAKVAEVEAGYPSLLAAQMKRAIYVNSTTGDDTVADGTASKPYETIKSAIESRPEMTKTQIVLAGGVDKSTAHVIDATINIGSRYVEVSGYDNHVVVSGSFSNAFTVDSGGALVFTEYLGSEIHIHVEESRDFVWAKGGCSVHFGGYGACWFYLPDSITLNFVHTKYTLARGITTLTSSNLRIMSSSDTSSPASAIVTSASFERAGTVLFNHYAASMGSSYSDYAGGVNTATIQGAFKAVSS